MNDSKTKIPSLTDDEEARIRKQIAADPDAAEAGDEDPAAVRRSRGRPPVEEPKQQISLRLDPDVIAAYKRTGKGWQGRINDILRKAAKL